MLAGSGVGARAAFAHSSDDAALQYRTRIVEVSPPGLPVDVRIIDGDQIRFENQGDGMLELCGYDDDGGRCDAWVRIRPDGVFVDRASSSYAANLDATGPADVPAAGDERAPMFVRVRRAPPFYAYHDHRVHWMGTALAPGVDAGDPRPQRVFDGTVRYRYDGVPGVVRARVEYVGGRSWFARRGEMSLVVAAIIVMLVAYGFDARRRRRRRGSMERAAG